MPEAGRGRQAQKEAEVTEVRAIGLWTSWLRIEPHTQRRMNPGNAKNQRESIPRAGVTVLYRAQMRSNVAGPGLCHLLDV